MSIFQKAKMILIDGPLKLIGYLKARLLEQSTWLSISAGIAAASALSPPWSFASIGVAVIVALLPTTKKKKGDCE